ncbi:hypothetical protein [Lyngbya sp. PCC 8106]|uniref:hypothetical protein n=1 Tax=Lyngbya sp. (strain PCC 8106) TaxID=313612 RepID=UPI0000EAC24D|nr:hypothetical protein [Lyngbya sp. PCC 8106]EAW34854.1 hypothetical protein L8106_18412 [Lyngbya sp. PCC 8106]
MNSRTKNQSQELLLNISYEEFNFERWAQAVKPQLIAALRGNFTTTLQSWKQIQQKKD